MSDLTALIAGPTGLVGRHLVELLINDKHYSKIVLLTRRSVISNHPKVEEVIVEDFDHLQSYRSQLSAHDYYCCLGTTIKQAGSKANFRKVDLQYPMMLAELAKQSDGYRQFLVVTAAGANAKSPLFYNQVKGELEDNLKGMNLQSLKIFRPSLLLGDRQEFRLGEEVAKFFSSLFSFFMVGLKRKLWAIKASDVASAMLFIAKQNRPGTKVYSTNDMVDRLKSLGF